MVEVLKSQIPSVLTIAVALGGILTVCAYLIYIERKISAFMQDRVGPNRVGPWGLLQPLADGAKFILKEDIIPSHVDKVLFILAPLHGRVHSHARLRRRAIRPRRFDA